MPKSLIDGLVQISLDLGHLHERAWFEYSILALKKSCNFEYNISHSYIFLNKFIYLFVYFWLCWVFVAARGLSLVVTSGGEWASHCGGFSCHRAQALGAWASVVVARSLSICGTGGLECRLSSCGARA